MFYEAKPEVMLGGGSAFFLPKADKAGKRKDEENYLEKFKAAIRPDTILASVRSSSLDDPGSGRSGRRKAGSSKPTTRTVR